MVAFVLADASLVDAISSRVTDHVWYAHSDVDGVLVISYYTQPLLEHKVKVRYQVESETNPRPVP